MNTLAQASGDVNSVSDASKAQLAIEATQKIISKIKRGDTTNLDSQIDEFISDNQSNQHLPWQIHKIARKFGQCIRYEEAKGLYQKLVQDYPNTEYGQNAVLEAERMKISALVDSGQESQAQAEITSLIANHGSRADADSTLYFIARRFERARKCSIDRYNKAISIHQHIIDTWPDSQFKERCRLDIQKNQLLTSIDSGNDSNVVAELNQLITNNKGVSHMEHVVSRIAEQYNKLGQKAELEVDRANIKANYQKAVGIWEIFFTTGFEQSKYTPVAYHWAGEAYHKSSDYAKALVCYQAIASLYPDYKFAPYAQFKTGLCYRNLKFKGLIAPETADSLAIEVFQKVIDHYPDSVYADQSQDWIAQISQ
jgi:outer membrane protein assembly factor BamD (BamD/ComL family)